MQEEEATVGGTKQDKLSVCGIRFLSIILARFLAVKSALDCIIAV